MCFYNCATVDLSLVTHYFSTLRNIDGLLAAASVTAIINISAKVASLCFQYLVAVKDAKKDIKRLRRTVTNVKNVLKEVKQLLDREDKTQLLTTHKLLDLLKEYS